MTYVHPLELLIVSMILLWLGLMIGSWIRVRRQEVIQTEKGLIKTLEGAVLTLFALLLGFMFSMAVGRYELRKQLILDEANAIGTTWLRTASMAEPARSQEQALLRQYVPVRIEFLASGSDEKRMLASLRQAAVLQARMWAIASSYASDHRDPITGLSIATLNQAIDLSESRTAAYENRIPLMAWVILLFIGFVATMVVGINVSSHSHVLRLVLPFVVGLALALTLDLDSPRYGLIVMTQPSMERVAQLVAGPPPQNP
jgi:hypothetical protein